MESLNRMATELVDEAIDFADELTIAVHALEGDAAVLDFGVEVPGAVEAGLLATEIQTAGLATVQTELSEVAGAPLTHVELSTDHPALGLLCAQKGGWELSVDGFEGLGSGPARALVAEEEIYSRVGYHDAADFAVLTIEADELPEQDVAAHVADVRIAGTGVRSLDPVDDGLIGPDSRQIQRRPRGREFVEEQLRLASGLCREQHDRARWETALELPVEDVDTGRQPPSHGVRYWCRGQKRSAQLSISHNVAVEERGRGSLVARSNRSRVERLILDGRDSGEYWTTQQIGRARWADSRFGQDGTDDRRADRPSHRCRLRGVPERRGAGRADYDDTVGDP